MGRVEENFTKETDPLTQLVKTKSIIGHEQKAQKLYARINAVMGLEMLTYQSC